MWARAPAKASSGSVMDPADEAGAERRRRHAGDGVGVGEHHLSGHAVGVEFLVALVGIPRAPQALFVLGLPPHDVVVVHLQRLTRGWPRARPGTRRTAADTSGRGRAGTPGRAARRGRRPR